MNAFTTTTVIIISGFILLQIVRAITSIKLTSHLLSGLRTPRHDPECRGKEAGTFVKDPYACDKFYYCAPDEVAFVVDCPYGMIFNDEKAICDFPDNYHCVPEIKETTKNSQATDSSTISASTNPKTTQSSTLSTPSSSKTTTSKDVTTHQVTSTVTIETRCPPKDSKTLNFLPHPNDCHRYFICYHGVPVAQECVPELHWNRKTNRCDYPINSDCLTSTVAPLTTVGISVGGIINCPFRGEQIFPHPVHCNYFIYCINGYATIQQCPFYHNFDFRTKMCLWQTVSKCTYGPKKIN